MSGQLFINYRRDDSAEAAQALYTQLAQHFSIAKLFMDVSSIEPGTVWPDRIRLALQSAEQSEFVSIDGEPDASVRVFQPPVALRWSIVEGVRPLI